MPRITVASQQAIIDQQAEQLSRLATKIRMLQGDVDQQHRTRKLLMQAAKQEATQRGCVVRVRLH